jgi:16S rRNA (cytidine1402-2'-O)-methyltransferase
MSEDEPNGLEVALYLVPTPIGNKEDITVRALRVLKSVDVIACEDTRTTGRLLDLYGIRPSRLIAIHDHNERGTAGIVVDALREGHAVAYCSDAGSPAISDPGFFLVRSVIDAGMTVIPLPGATALIPALTASGAPCMPFTFVGFAPHKKGRMTFLDAVVRKEETVVMYESPFRIAKLIDELHVRCPERSVCIAREISKVFEEFIRGSVRHVKDLLAARPPLKGEIVVILHGTRGDDPEFDSNHDSNHDS